MLATQMQDIHAYVSLCHTDAREIRLRDFLRYMKERSIHALCCRTAAISAPFTPPAAFRFQPLPAVASLGVDVDITFHHITSQLLVLTSALVSALLGVPHDIAR